MANNMGQVMKGEVVELIELTELKNRAMILFIGHQDKVVVFQLKTLVMDKMEMGEVKKGMIKRSIQILGLTIKVIAMKRVIQKIPMSLR